MAIKPVKIPGSDHPITIERNPRRVRAVVDGITVADTHAALTLHEADFPAVQYVPRADVEMARLERSSGTSYCPYKGDCNYYTLIVEGNHAVDAVWTYERAYPAVRPIRGYLAFDPRRVEILYGE